MAIPPTGPLERSTTRMSVRGPWRGSATVRSFGVRGMGGPAPGRRARCMVWERAAASSPWPARGRARQCVASGGSMPPMFTRARHPRSTAAARGPPTVSAACCRRLPRRPGDFGQRTAVTISSPGVWPAAMPIARVRAAKSPSVAGNSPRAVSARCSRRASTPGCAVARTSAKPASRSAATSHAVVQRCSCDDERAAREPGEPLEQRRAERRPRLEQRLAERERRAGGRDERVAVERRRIAVRRDLEEVAPLERRLADAPRVDVEQPARALPERHRLHLRRREAPHLVRRPQHAAPTQHAPDLAERRRRVRRLLERRRGGDEVDRSAGERQRAAVAGGEGGVREREASRVRAAHAHAARRGIDAEHARARQGRRQRQRGPSVARAEVDDARAAGRQVRGVVGHARSLGPVLLAARVVGDVDERHVAAALERQQFVEAARGVERARWGEAAPERLERGERQVTVHAGSVPAVRRRIEQMIG